jgi:hypothetical protein
LPIVKIAAVATAREYTEAVPTLRQLEERRAYECRLTPDRALQTLDEAQQFIEDRSLVTLTPDCALPSLFEACHEEPYRPGSRGFGLWPKTKYWWGVAISERVCATRIHRGKTLLLSAHAARLADPICRAELVRMEAADPRWARLLRHLADAGPSLVEELQEELGLKPRELEALRLPLERCGAVVRREVVVETDGGAHRHTSELARWDQLFPAPPQRAADLGELVFAGVRAAVVAPEREARRWFSWVWRWDDALLERLLAEGRIARAAPGWLCATEVAAT